MAAIDTRHDAKSLRIDPLEQGTPRFARSAWTLLRAMRPTQWLKNGVLFAGLVFGGKLFDPEAVVRALAAAFLFCLISSGFYLLNDVRDLDADRLHPLKKRRPVAAGELARGTAMRFGIGLVLVSALGAWLLGPAFFAATCAYAVLMTAYNLGLKQMVVVDVLAIALGFVIRAAAGAIAVNVRISPWLLVCTLLLALVLALGKRRYELASLADASGHRRNLETYTPQMLDQAVAVTAAGALIAYAVYTIDADAVPADHRMVLTVPIVTYGVLRYLYLLYRKGEGGAPELLLLADRGLLAAVAIWGVLSAILFYFSA